MLSCKSWKALLSCRFFTTSYSYDEAVGRNVGGFVMVKRRGEAGRQGGIGVNYKKEWEV